MPHPYYRNALGHVYGPPPAPPPDYMGAYLPGPELRRTTSHKVMMMIMIMRMRMRMRMIVKPKSKS